MTDCNIDQVCSLQQNENDLAIRGGQGYCIDRCRSRLRADVETLRRQIRSLEEVVVIPGRRGGNPCWDCPLRVEGAAIAQLMDRAGTPQPVHVEITDRRGRTVLDLGTHKPTGGKFPSLSRAMQARPSVALDVSRRGRCGYQLRLTNERGEELASGRACLSGD